MLRSPLSVLDGKLFALLCVVAASLACVAPDSDDGVSPNDSLPDIVTGTLGGDCFSDSNCNGSLICLCGVCTQACSAPGACDLGADGAGFDLECLGGIDLIDSGRCGAGLGEAGICVGACSVAADCAGDSFTYRCVDGVCEPRTNGGVFTDVGRPDGGGDDAGGAEDAGSDADGGAPDTGSVGCAGGTVVGPDADGALEVLRSCTSIEGSLELRDVEDIDMTVFASLTGVDRDLRIIGGSVADAPEVVFPALETVGGTLELDGVRVSVSTADRVGAPALTRAGSVLVRGIDASVVALGALEAVEDGLEVSELFTTELALYQLQTVGRTGLIVRDVSGISRVEARSLRRAGTIVLETLPGVTQLQFLALTGATREFRLRALPQLVDVQLGFLTVEDAFELRGLTRLDDLSGFDSVSAQNGWRELIIADNAALVDTSDLATPPQMRTGGTLSVIGNPQLVGMTALLRISSIPSSVTVRVVDNPRLPACRVAAWLLDSWDGASEVSLETANVGNDETALCD